MEVFSLFMFVVSMWLNTVHMSFPALYHHAVSRVNTALCGPPVTALTPYFEFYCSALEVARTAAPPSTLFPESSLFDPSKSNFSVFAPVFSGCSVNCTTDDSDALELVQVDAQFLHSTSELIVAPKFELSVVSAPESSLPVCLVTEFPVRLTIDGPVRLPTEGPVRQILIKWYFVLVAEWIIYFFLFIVYYRLINWILSRIVALKRSLLALFNDAKIPQAAPQVQPAAPAAEGRRRRRRRNNNNNNNNNNGNNN